MGSDVGPELPDVQRRSALKSVLSGTGYENGLRCTVGASRKGRIWSHRRERVDQLAEWCKAVGSKLLDDRIDPDEVLKGTLEAQTLTERPNNMPISIDWPEEFYKTPEVAWTLIFDETEIPLAEVDIELSSPAKSGPLRFALVSGTTKAEIDLSFFVEEDVPNYRLDVLGEARVRIKSGARSQPIDITRYFYDNPPVIWFADGSSLEGNQYVELKGQYTPYDATKIAAWDWNRHQEGISGRNKEKRFNTSKGHQSIKASAIQCDY